MTSIAATNYDNSGRFLLAQKGLFMDCKNYPRYFQVSDTIIRLEDNRDGTISGYVEATGEPYPPAKAIVDGTEILD